MPAGNPRPNPANRNDRPFSDAEKKIVAELHSQGVGRNEISRRTGIHQRRVSEIAKSLGLTFRRSYQTKEATEAKKADARAMRAALAVKLLEDAENIRQQLFQPAYVWNFGGKDNTFADAMVQRPSFRDQYYMAGAISTLVERAIRLDEYDRDTGLDAAKSMLANLGAALGAAWQMHQQAAGNAD